MRAIHHLDCCKIGKILGSGYGLSIFIDHYYNCKNCKKNTQAVNMVKRLKNTSGTHVFYIIK